MRLEIIHNTEMVPAPVMRFRHDPTRESQGISDL